MNVVLGEDHITDEDLNYNDTGWDGSRKQLGRNRSRSGHESI